MLQSDKRCLCVVSVDTVYQQVLHYAIHLYVSMCLFICVHKGTQKRLNNKQQPLFSFYGYNKQTKNKDLWLIVIYIDLWSFPFV